MQANVRASDVRSTHNEPFDGNIAFVASGRDHSVEGRADVLRIGRRHLLELLDIQDPNHLDAALNRIRGAMIWGYPDKVRVSFSHGFARVNVTFGGLARLVKLDEISGIAIGPFLDRFASKVGFLEEKQ